jgi:hypothetical protein
MHRGFVAETIERRPLRRLVRNLDFNITVEYEGARVAQ